MDRAHLIPLLALTVALLLLNWTNLVDAARGLFGCQRPIRFRFPRLRFRTGASRPDSSSARVHASACLAASDGERRESVNRRAGLQPVSARPHFDTVATVDAATQRRVLAALTDDNIGGVRLVASQRVH
jgi:hypothetical protein